eukprot:CAMPEP_0175093908 /NCGR_PEP_ID=MMETSP0086_2-20121207/3282_1 /TAXON_ID=136419 /ORGANISM="Unknown Unknown, Strain D1" /LENGTH=139 /DNA_ID=CAMNT_0016366939 /DNA_START=21 /DNA_END=440 /DNA_ORIENTATION=+
MGHDLDTATAHPAPPPYEAASEASAPLQPQPSAPLQPQPANVQYAPVAVAQPVYQVAQPVYPKFKSQSVQAPCHTCGTVVQTQTEKIVGTITWVAAAGMCFVGCGLCAWAPFVGDWAKDTLHYCPQCRTVLGKKEQFEL